MSKTARSSGSEGLRYSGLGIGGSTSSSSSLSVFPTIPLRDPDEHEAFSENNCVAKLRKVGRSSEQIRGMATWIFHHRNHLAHFVKLWIAQFKKASPHRRLTLYYVAHETLALCKKKRFEKGFQCFQSVLREATVYSRDKECKIGVRKVLAIFKDASFFGDDFLRQLHDDLEKGRSTMNHNRVILNDFDPDVISKIHEQMEGFRESTLNKAEKSYREKEADLEIGDPVIGKIKEHSVGKEHLEKFDAAFTSMQEAEEAQEQDLQYEYDLVNQLEILRIFYATASKESEKVVLAYGNYEKVATNGIQHLEKALDLLNIPLPASGPGNGNTADDTVDMDLSDDENNTDKRTFIPPASPSGEAQKEMEPIDDDDDDVPYSPPDPHKATLVAAPISVQPAENPSVPTTSTGTVPTAAWAGSNSPSVFSTILSSLPLPVPLPVLPAPVPAPVTAPAALPDLSMIQEMPMLNSFQPVPHPNFQTSIASLTSQLLPAVSKESSLWHSSTATPIDIQASLNTLLNSDLLRPFLANFTASSAIRPLQPTPVNRGEEQVFQMSNHSSPLQPPPHSTTSSAFGFSHTPSPQYSQQRPSFQMANHSGPNIPNFNPVRPDSMPLSSPDPYYAPRPPFNSPMDRPHFDPPPRFGQMATPLSDAGYRPAPPSRSPFSPGAPGGTRPSLAFSPSSPRNFGPPRHMPYEARFANNVNNGPERVRGPGPGPGAYNSPQFSPRPPMDNGSPNYFQRPRFPVDGPNGADGWKQTNLANGPRFPENSLRASGSNLIPVATTGLLQPKAEDQSGNAGSLTNRLMQLAHGSK